MQRELGEKHAPARVRAVLPHGGGDHIAQLCHARLDRARAHGARIDRHVGQDDAPWGVVRVDKADAQFLNAEVQLVAHGFQPRDQRHKVGLVRKIRADLVKRQPELLKDAD